MLGAEQAYEGLYGQGPPSVSSHGGRPFQQGMCLFTFNNFCLWKMDLKRDCFWFFF